MYHGMRHLVECLFAFTSAWTRNKEKHKSNRRRGLKEEGGGLYK